MEPAIQKKKQLTEKIRQFCTFKLENRLYGVDILDVKEVNPQIEFTPIFHAPGEVKGYVNIRGQIHLILDLRLFFGFDSKPVDDASKLVLFKPKVGESFGVMVDCIGDVVLVDENQIEDRRKESQGLPDTGERRSMNLASGVCKLKDELLIILNPEHLLKHIGNKI